jgi:hypothetical protein
MKGAAHPSARDGRCRERDRVRLQLVMRSSAGDMPLQERAGQDCRLHSASLGSLVVSFV